MRPKWSVLYRIAFRGDHGNIVDCGSRSWAQTADEAAANVRKFADVVEIVAVRPWTDDDYKKTIAEAFAERGKGVGDA